MFHITDDQIFNPDQLISYYFSKILTEVVLERNICK